MRTIKGRHKTGVKWPSTTTLYSPSDPISWKSLLHWLLSDPNTRRSQWGGIFFPVLTIDGEIFRVDGWGFVSGNLVQELKCSNEALNCVQFYKCIKIQAFVDRHHHHPYDAVDQKLKILFKWGLLRYFETFADRGKLCGLGLQCLERVFSRTWELAFLELLSHEHHLK